MTLVVTHHLVPSVSKLGWDELEMGVAHHWLFWCHIAASDVAPGFHMCPFMGAGHHS